MPFFWFLMSAPDPKTRPTHTSDTQIKTTSEPHPEQWQKLREKWFLAIPRRPDPPFPCSLNALNIRVVKTVVLGNGGSGKRWFWETGFWETVVLGNGGFGKRWFWETPKTSDCDENGENDECAFYTQKQGLWSQNPENDENGENGWCHSGKIMAYRKRGFTIPRIWSRDPCPVAAK